MLLVAVVASGCTSPQPTQIDPFEPHFEWTRHPSTTAGRTEVAAAAIGPLIFTVGGFTDGALATSMVEVFHAAEERWASTTPYPIPIHHATAVAHGGLLYVLGGFTTSAFVATDLAFRYDPGSGLWTPLPQLPAARGAHAAALVDGNIYVVGGVGTDGSLLEAVHALHLETETWTTVAPLPTPRDHLAASALGPKLYAAGGRNLSPGANLDVMEVFDPGRNSWSTLRSMPTPRGGIGAASWEGSIVVAGGETASSTFAEVEAYDPATGQWRTLPPLPTPRHGLGVAVAGDRFYALLGGPEPGLATSGAAESLGLIYEL